MLGVFDGVGIVFGAAADWVGNGLALVKGTFLFDAPGKSFLIVGIVALRVGIGCGFFAVGMLSLPFDMFVLYFNNYLNCSCQSVDLI
jgi:hypothetical protein